MRPHAERPLRIAIIGAGKMGRHHARAARSLDAVAELVALVDPSESARTEAGRDFDVPTYADLDALLAAGGADVAHICTSPDTHVPLASAALNAGLHVYVEKPIAPAVESMRELSALAEARGRSICAGHQLLAEPPMVALRQRLPAIGRIVHIESYFSFRTVRRAPGGRAPLRADLQLLDVLPHPTYLLLDVLRLAHPGEPTTIRSMDVGPPGTVHLTAARADTHGSLVITLDGRPVESYLRVVGTRGCLEADFVRGILVKLVGPGTSGIDKALHPYRVAWQLGMRTTRALTGRVLRRRLTYPGLAEMFGAFYASIRAGTPSPTPADALIEGVEIWERVADALREATRRAELHAASVDGGVGPTVVVTGGTGFLGAALVRTLLDQGFVVRVLARRMPVAWERIPGARYDVADIGDVVDPELLRDADVVVHCAAETAGGWDDHQRNSIDATGNVLRAGAHAGVTRFIHVSSLAVVQSVRGQASEASALEPDGRSRGPYVWGKLESERLAARVAEELGVELRVVRPGAIIDRRDFEPPGRLGKRVGPLFVAVGSRRGRFGTVDRQFAADAIAWIARNFADAPRIAHLVDPDPPTRGELIAHMRGENPDLRVFWLPRWLLVPLSGMAVVAQKLLRPGRPPIRLGRVFADQDLDTSTIRGIRDAMQVAPSVPAPARDALPAPTAVPRS